MLGLLYKDYIAVKGKYFLMALFGQFLLLTVLRLTVVDEVVDHILPPMVMMMLCCFAAVLPLVFELSLMKADEGRKQKQYFLSLPVSRRQYVASKYIFLAIAFYIIQSVATFEFVVCQVNMKSEEMSASMATTQMLVPTFIGICMVICALELPFFVGMGVKKGMAAKESIIFIVFFLGVAYVMFGDLSIVEEANVMSLIDYFMKHPEISMTVQVLSPIISILLYYVSYLISARLFEGKEWEDE